MNNDKKTITLTPDGETELNFAIDLSDYNGYINAIKQGNLIQPAHNFLMRVASDEATKAAIKQYYQQAYTTDLLAAVLQAYKPEIEFTVKA